MPITSKTRKTLWARSGNRCAMCRSELVAEKNDFNRNLNIGDECHIISEKSRWPRHIIHYWKNYDDYENLILLCRNHHKAIDELWETYSADMLRNLKKKHEDWIKTIIDKAKKTKDKTVILRLHSGKEIVNIIKGVQAYYFDYSGLESKRESKFIGNFLQNIQDWWDVMTLNGYEIGATIELEYNLDKEIKKLEALWFCIYGNREKINVTYKDQNTSDIWHMAILCILETSNLFFKDSSEIIIDFNNSIVL